MTDRKYFVSYYYQDKKGRQGHGSITMVRQGKIIEHTSIDEMNTYIKELNEFTNLAILNWRPYETPNVSEGKSDE